MRRLSLRSRLLIAVGLVVLVQVLAAVVVISVTSDQLLDQIDERLAAASAVAEGSASGLATGEGEALEQIADVYQGILKPDGALMTVNEVTDRGEVVPPPQVSTGAAVRASGRPFTVEAVNGDDEYRVVALQVGDGGTLILASQLDGYEWTLNRVTRLVIIAAVAVSAVLGAVTWWVIRVGIAPVKRMTTTAEAIAAGDLSERIEGARPDTEAGQLGVALNTMMGRIESSFEERTRAEERLRQFIADASHELRTPVATIRGYAELYQAGGLGDPAALDDAMRRTTQESERMSRLIADLLGLAKLDRTPELRTDPVDLCEVARDVVADAAATEPHRTVVADLPNEPLIVNGDEDLLRQALSNLVGNALVHTDCDATTTVTVTGDRANATVTVVDHGEGMSADVVDRVTERFFRADPSRSRRNGGSGLGLAIVDSIVAAHDGELRITSTPGEGTSAAFVLPIRHRGNGSQQTHGSL